MKNDKEQADIMRSIAEKSLQLMTNFNQTAPRMTEHLMDLSSNYQTLMSSLFSNPEKITQMQTDWCQDAFKLLQDQVNNWGENKPGPIIDKRFSHDEWVSNPIFNALSQHYLLACKRVNTLLDDLPNDDTSSIKRLRFFMRQYLDALSPDNFIHTNPELIAITLQSQGKNLLHGLHNFLSDIDTDSQQLRIKMTDTDAFKPGENLAITPGKVIFKNEMMELLQYTPVTSKVGAVPLLIIPPWINKYYILDLSQHNSLVRWLVEQGTTVFMISWINPDARHANKGIYDYLNEGPMAAIKTIQKQLNVPQVNALGFCIGGTLLSMLLAYYKAHDENPVKSATFLAAMIDFSDPGDISVFIDEQQISKLEEQMQAKGYLDGHLMAGAFNSLRASDLIWSFFIKNYLRGQEPAPFDILYWNGDSTNMPALMHSQYLRWMYLQNDLIKPGGVTVNNTPLNISKIDIPVFFISTQKDHIAPWQTTFTGFQTMQGKKQFVLGGSGHIAGIIIPPGNEKYGFYTNKNGDGTPETWLANATKHSGSWWPEWMKWLKKESGKVIDAPDINALPFRPLLDAPGEYVHMKN